MAKGDTFMGFMILLLIALAFLMCFMIAQGKPASGNWELSGLGQVSYMTVGDSDMLYAFSGNSVYAIDSQGRLRWNFTQPDSWRICQDTGRYFVADNRTIRLAQGSNDLTSTPIIDSEGGSLYALVSPDLNTSIYHLYDARWEGGIDNLSVVSISPNGRASWSVPVGGNLSAVGWATVDARQTGVYVFHGYNETLIDKRGNVEWNIENVSDPAAVDEQGFVYTVTAVGRELFSVNYVITNYSDCWNGTYFDYREPSGVVRAFYPNGTLYWSKDIGEPIIRQQMWDSVDKQFKTLPVYDKGTVYVPVSSGVIALDRQGNEIWTRHFDGGDFRLFEMMPFDNAGNVYLRYFNVNDTARSYVYVISPDGSRVSGQMPFDSSGMAASDGILYYTASLPAVEPPDPWAVLNNGQPWVPRRNLTDLDTVAVSAHDFIAGMDVWRFVVPVNDTTEGVVTADNADRMHDWLNEARLADDQYRKRNNATAWNLSRSPQAQVLPGKNIVYVVFSTACYESPIVVNQSKFVYSGGIYALDNGGKLVWSKPLDSFVTSASVNGTVIYYSTGDGKIAAGSVDVAAGLALLAAIYVFIRFFLVGAVSRARARLDGNENRGRILKFIVSEPGSNMREVASALKMNIGTVRYHLFILTLNHKIVSISADEKYLRYFTNSGTYSKESQLVIALMRREGINRVLTALSENPCMSNREISQRSGIQESAVSRYMKELAEKGIVIKEKAAGGATSFSIADGYRAHITSAIQRINCQ
jgi:predicted transcriptional regulator